MPGHSIVVLDRENPIWEKLPEESSKSFGAFIVYRNLPTHKRSMREAIIQLYGEWTSTRQRLFQRWCAQHAWVARASAWDQYLDQQSQIQQVEDIKAMNKRHVNIGKTLQQKALEKLKKLDSELLDIEDVLAFLNAGVKFERQGLGEPDQIISLKEEITEETIDYSKMTTEQLKTMLAKRAIELLSKNPPTQNE